MGNMKSEIHGGNLRAKRGRADSRMFRLDREGLVGARGKAGSLLYVLIKLQTKLRIE